MMTTRLDDHLRNVASLDAEPTAEGEAYRSLPAAVLRIPVTVQIVIGSVRLALSQLTRLAPGTALTLEEKLGAPVRLLVNGREVAQGELFVVDELSGRLGVTITAVSGVSTDS
jgi:flagellar motor switch protein FliN/FliY